jgi:ABC-type antimicrobial peptide transport system permease subunit
VSWGKVSHDAQEEVYLPPFSFLLSTFAKLITIYLQTIETKDFLA